MAKKPKQPTEKTSDASSEIEVAPEALAGRSCAEPEIVRWVARNIDNPAVDPEDCPDSFAWTLLRQCRQNPEFVGFFIEKLWVKLLASTARNGDDDADKDIDGAPTIRIIEKICAARDDAIQRDGAVGSSKAS